MGAVAGVIGTLQATEVLKELLGLGVSMSGQLLIFDAMEMIFRKISYKRNVSCDPFVGIPQLLKIFVTISLDSPGIKEWD